ncbi:unnamed protein product [Cylicocyclus nassatus]|uniref:Uncharacterized protein n=1 Tax=Cylicocyclus nassatus TaxID=53992 RepID=A0AA36MGP0_CYLNA|nr:unnamed protein product [Cylicocyclus nassatus]
MVFSFRVHSQVMERLSSAIDTLVDDTCNGLLKPKHIRAAAKECGLKLDRSEADAAVTRLVTLFRTKFRSGIDEIVRESKIEEKLANLEVLAASCKAKCEELGVTDGYRPLGVEEDLEGHIYPIVSAYQEALTNKNAELEHDIERTRDELKQANGRVNLLAKKAEALMADKDESLP